MIVSSLAFAISSANFAQPMALMRMIQAWRSERKMNWKILEIKLLNFLQLLQSANILQSAQLAYLFSKQQLRILHQHFLASATHPWQPPLK